MKQETLKENISNDNSGHFFYCGIMVIKKQNLIFPQEKKVVFFW